jgi:tetrapyrrole methylase family protein / MazG family protein
MPGRVVVVGLGPAGADHLLAAARQALETATARYVRTARHPAVADLVASGMQFVSFDSVYDGAPDLDHAYEQMVDTLVAAARDTDVVYAVPGHPLVAERTVVLLGERVRVEIVPGLSFADLAWARLGVDPMESGARVVDGRNIEATELAGPMLFAQCDNALVLSDVKLSLLEHLAPDMPVTVLQRLGTPDEHIEVLPLVELDRGVEPDHLTSLYVDAPHNARDAAVEFTRLVRLVRRLRDPGGCPWDAEQTHRSLSRYLLEESYEVVETIEAGRTEDGALADELGDVLYQVVFHAAIAEESDAFTIADVARGIHDKLVRRHPHVFGDVVADEPDAVVRNWEQIKKAELGHASIVEGTTDALPSLLYTHKLFSKAASVGLDPGSREEALDRLELAIARARETPTDDLDASLGQLLAAAVAWGRAAGFDAESALRGWAARYRARFEAIEQLALDRGLDLASLDQASVAALWIEAAAT